MSFAIRGAVVALLVAFSPPQFAVLADAVEEGLRSRTAALGHKAPIVRVGLAHDHSISVSGRKGFRIIDARTGESLWKARFSEEIQVVAEGGPTDGVASIYRIQVGAFADETAARKELRRLTSLVGGEGVVRHDPDRGNWRVRLGRASQRLGLGPQMDELRRQGIQGMWIAEEPAQAVSGITLRLVDGSYDSFATDLDRIVVVPSSGGRISIGGKPYRGLIELRVSPYGTVRPINWVELEQYLLGVVPAELGPEVWPEIEALKAQSVAARTYIWRNRGQFADEGFDLCATPRCQVYHGASVEHPLSDRAIWGTRGEVLKWEGRPIIALYTATCGGHTENGGEIFPEHDVPYLRGVPCRAESEALDSQGAAIRGRHIDPVLDSTGADVTRDWVLLSVAGVLNDGLTNTGTAHEHLTANGLRAGTRGLARISGLPEPSGSLRQVETLGQAAATLLAEMGWTERAKVLLSLQDLPALLRDVETAALDPDEQRALAYLAWVEALGPFADGRYRPNEPPTLGRLAPGMVRIGESYAAFGLKDGVIAGVGADSVRLIRGKSSVRRPLAKDVCLFGLSGGKSSPVDRLDLWPGDRVRYRTNGKGVIDFLELRPPVKGVSDDRSAKVYSWEVRKTRRQLEAAINRRVSVGTLRDLRVVRRGVSGRVVELEVVGSKGSTIVRGFDVRRLLDLREILLVIEVQRDAKGKIEAVVFAGKGWGHGVGMCQVGAYGMALRGASYGEILSHYYTGASLDKLSPDDP